MAKIPNVRTYHSRNVAKHLSLTCMKKNRLDGYYNGVASLVEPDDWVSQQDNMNLNLTQKPTIPSRFSSATLPFEPIAYNAFEEYSSSEYLEDHYPVEECFLDVDSTIRLPEIFAYP